METRTFSRHLRERDLFYAFLRMPAIDQVPAVVVQPELMSEESILWAGQPQCSVIFHKEDSFLIPFSLLGVVLPFFGKPVLRDCRGTLQQSSIAIYPLGHPFCGDRAILDLGEICLRGMA